MFQGWQNVYVSIKPDLTEIGGKVERKYSFLDLLFEVLNLSTKHKAKKRTEAELGRVLDDRSFLSMTDSCLG